MLQFEQQTQRNWGKLLNLDEMVDEKMSETANSAERAGGELGFCAETWWTGLQMNSSFSTCFTFFFLVLFQVKEAFFTAHILSCPSEKSTGVTNNMLLTMAPFYSSVPVNRDSVTSMNNNRTLKLKQLNGIQPVLFLLWHVKNILVEKDL